MGLLDVLNGMQNGPRGAPTGGSGSGGGMSPMTMALIGLLAYKAIKSFGGQGTSPGAAPQMPGNAGATGGGGLGNILGGLLGGGAAGRPGSNLNDLIPGGLGGLLNSPAAGGVLSGGLASVIKDLQNSGQGKAAQSWVGNGDNQEIEPNDLAKALGGDAIDAMVKHTGMSRDDLLENLSQQLPQMVNHLTPDGRLPTEAEAARMV